MNQNKLASKDLITLAIFSIIFALMISLIVAVVGLVPIAYPFAFAVALVPCGIVWMYLRAKVQKKGSIILQGVISALFMLLFGTYWAILVALLVGAVIAELITQAGEYKSFPKTAVGYVIFGVCVNLGAFLPPLLMPEYYYSYCIANGMDTVYIEQLLAFLSGPMLMLSTALCVGTGIIGAFLGRKSMHKHFLRAGIA